jgi:hypothetical protein
MVDAKWDRTSHARTWGIVINKSRRPISLVAARLTEVLPDGRTQSHTFGPLPWRDKPSLVGEELAEIRTLMGDVLPLSGPGKARAVSLSFSKVPAATLIYLFGSMTTPGDAGSSTITCTLSPRRTTTGDSLISVLRTGASRPGSTSRRTGAATR